MTTDSEVLRASEQEGLDEKLKCAGSEMTKSEGLHNG